MISRPQYGRLAGGELMANPPSSGSSRNTNARFVVEEEDSMKSTVVEGRESRARLARWRRALLFAAWATSGLAASVGLAAFSGSAGQPAGQSQNVSVTAASGQPASAGSVTPMAVRWQ